MNTTTTNTTGGAVIGYARTSTRDQHAGLEAQLKDLQRAGRTRIYKKQLSPVRVAERQQLEAAIDFAREGDVFVVTKFDRLARSLPHLLQVIERLQVKGVALRILSLNIDTSTASGKLMLNVMGAIAEFERELMLERQRDDIAAAKADGRYKGRQPTARAKSDEVRRFATEGCARKDIARRCSISVASVYRILVRDQVAGCRERETRLVLPQQ
jgi:DNA invertase Pin-like site-specific DNA recombinase